MGQRRSMKAPIIALALAAGTLAAAPAMAAGPVIERIPIDDEFSDTFLSEECGVEVVTRATGMVIMRSFGDGTGPVELQTINVGLTATAGDNTVRFRDVGADLLRQLPDGTLVLSVTGQIPFAFTGVIKFDPETGEVFQAPHNSTADNVDRFCARLTA